MTSSNPPDPRADQIRGQALVQAMKLAEFEGLDAEEVLKAAEKFEAFLRGETNDKQS